MTNESSQAQAFEPFDELKLKQAWFMSGPAQGIVGPKATILSEVYSYILNINRIFI